MRHSLLFALLTSRAAADRTCLGWGALTGPVGGLLCYFNHEKFRAIDNTVEEAAIVVENKAVSDVENAISSLKDAGKFLLSHHPVTLAYDFSKTAKSNGVQQATSQLNGQVNDVLDMDVGVVKTAGNIAIGTANLAINTLSIVALKHWRDAALCTVKEFQGSNQQVMSAKDVMARSNVNTTSKCIVDAFQALSKPDTFTIQSPSQKVGSTLAQVFSLFVPVAGEEAGVGLAGRDLYDLAIAGSEDAGRIYKQVGGETQHFAGEEEALTVQGKLDDEAWTAANCVPCKGPLGVAASQARRRRNKLARRGDSLTGLRCNLPEGTPPGNAGEDTLAVEKDNFDPDDSSDYDESATRVIREEELTAPPALRTWGDITADKASVIADMKGNYYTTANIAWDPAVISTFPPTAPRTSASQEVLHLLRDAFEGEFADHATFHDWLGMAHDVDAPGRLHISSSYWRAPSADDANAVKLAAFTKATTTQALKITQELKGVTDAEIGGMLYSDIDYFYLPKGDFNIATLDLRGQHVDPGVLQLVAADQPGLVLSEGFPKGFNKFRAPILSNGWNIIACTEFDGETRWGAATLHTVFGPEIVQNGRVSMIVNVRVNPFAKAAWAEAVLRGQSRQALGL